MRKHLFIVGLVPLLWGCADTAAPKGPGRVTIRFRANAARASAAVAPSQAALNRLAAVGPITVTGTNGTLRLDDIRLIVSKLELEREDAACEDSRDEEKGRNDEKACEEFEGGPFLVNLLDGSAANVVTDLVAPGTYSEFQFKVENLDADDDDGAAERQGLQTILAQLRQTYPKFPTGASMVVRGTFTPTGGVEQPFTVYFDAEIEVERELRGGFRVPEDVALLVDLDPTMWFRQGQRVLNLAALDGRTVEFEAELEGGIEVEFEK